VGTLTPIRRRLQFAFPPALATLFLLQASPAHAALLLTPDCSASGESLGCRLTGVLSFLYVAAALLAVLLLLAIGYAVRYYRKDKRKDLS
jgi:hypothetical protein